MIFRIPTSWVIFRLSECEEASQPPGFVLWFLGDWNGWGRGGGTRGLEVEKMGCSGTSSDQIVKWRVMVERHSG